MTEARHGRSIGNSPQEFVDSPAQTDISCKTLDHRHSLWDFWTRRRVVHEQDELRRINTSGVPATSIACPSDSGFYGLRWIEQKPYLIFGDLR
jgi:hypothetical protein